MHLLRKFWALEPADRRLILQIVIVLPLTALGLHVFGFKRTQAGLCRWGRVPQAPPDDEASRVRRARQWMRYVKRNGPYRGNCLSRSLVLWWLLRRQGIETELRIGTRLDDGRFHAHAWVEKRGQALIGGGRARARLSPFEQNFTRHIGPSTE